MEVRAWLICVLLEPCCQRSQHAGAICLSQEGDVPQRQAPPPHKSSKMAQAKPDIRLIQSKPGTQARPYSLSLSPDDYHQYLPKPKRLLHATRLMKLLGSSYDPFWMSLEDPRGQNTSQEELGTLNQDLAEHTAQFRKKLLQEAKALDFSDLLPSEDGIPHNLSQALLPRLHQWLVASASCHLKSSWVDMGPIFWPRWVRHTDCDLMDAGCSWPPGMSCQPAQTTHIKLLAWHCWMNRDHTSSHRKSLQQCTWRQVPYPVVAACKCSC
ncbi:Noggin [Varanus komodoensis]|uniref:noggin-like n=1 Tax=Varanus komodoensis TaxID=61221 RepID=UPI001CF7D034|nr:noggin-like [Varanus komodoensis]KAF7240527.1 Noggin [Varanus komodoensis]